MNRIRSVVLVLCGLLVPTAPVDAQDVSDGQLYAAAVDTVLKRVGVEGQAVAVARWHIQRSGVTGNVRVGAREMDHIAPLRVERFEDAVSCSVAGDPRTCALRVSGADAVDAVIAVSEPRFADGSYSVALRVIYRSSSVRSPVGTVLYEVSLRRVAGKLRVVEVRVVART